MRIRLTPTELMVAGYVGSARNVQAIMKGWKRTSPMDTFRCNIEGAAGEIAVAKMLNVYWQPIVGDPGADDVGLLQVRTNMSRKYEDTCLRPDDRDDRPYISVLSFMPEFDIIGWIWGKDAKKEEWLRDGTPGRPQCFYVPRSALKSMEELPELKAA